MSAPPSLPIELTIYTASELRQQWLDWLHSLREAFEAGIAEEDPVEIDASAVAEVDGAGVQLLLSLSNALGPLHRELRLLQPSRVLVEACSALGVDQLVGDGETVAEPDGAMA